MESAFRTVLSAAGVVAACYILIAANWIQVLLLFLAASLGWCVFACKAKTGQSFAARRQRQPFFFEHTLEQQNAQAPEPALESKPGQQPARAEQRQPQAPVAVHRFPIHKLSPIPGN